MRIFALVGVSLLMAASGSQGQTPKDPGAIQIIHSGSQPSYQAPAEHFTGTVRVDPLFRAKAPGHVGGALVTFEPGARTAWHTHPLGQILIVTAGRGLVQRSGDPVQEIQKGDVVWIPAGQKHWHGAAPDSSMAHIAIVEQLDGKSVQWMEKVSDAQYEKAPSASEGVEGMTKEPSAAQKVLSDIDPKLAELTD